MRTEILEFAKDQVGKKEISGNQGFKDPLLDRAMRRVGFENGWAWCALFAELCYAEPTYSGKSKVIASISDCFSANAVKTYENFEADKTGYFATDSKQALEGSVVIWEKRRDGHPVKKGIWTLGHAGIVLEVHKDYFMAIEGNTNSNGGREGIEIAIKKRTFNNFHTDGLCLKGFITPLL